MKKWMICVSLFCMMLGLTGCITVGSAASEKKAVKAVTQVLGYEPTLTDVKTEKSEYTRFKKNKYYEFEDKQGMRFSYASTVEPEGLDGATFFYRYRDQIHYEEMLVPFYGEVMQKLCDEHGKELELEAYGNGQSQVDAFGNLRQFMGAAIIIDGYADLEDTAQLVYEMLVQCRREVPRSGLMASASPEIYVNVRDDRWGIKVAKFPLLLMDEAVSQSEVYDKLSRGYVEMVKTGHIKDDLPENLLENLPPEVLRGIYNSREYDQWVAVLASSSGEDAVYSYKLYYREPTEREDYQFIDVYNNQDFSIEAFIAQLGGTMFFHEAEKGGDGAGFSGYLGEDSYFVGFTGADHQVLIRKNEEEYIFDTQMNNPAMNEYDMILTKEQMEDIFGIQISYDYAASRFTVSRDRNGGTYE